MPDDETLTNILNLLQKNTTYSGSNNQNNTKNATNNFDWQSLLIKFILSGSLNNLFNSRPQTAETTPPPPAAEAPRRTINLENYKRLD